MSMLFLNFPNLEIFSIETAKIKIYNAFGEKNETRDKNKKIAKEIRSRS